MSSVSGKKLLVIAIACGLLAALLGWLYLKAKESQYRAAYQPARQVMLSVIVPKQDIGKAQSLTPENVAVMDVPREYLPSNAVMAEDWPRLENRMTVQPLQKGRPISWDSVEQDGVSRFSENVELGKRIKTVKVSKINSFDGMLRPGDRIDLLGTFSATDIGLQEQPNYSDEVVINVLEDVEVLAAGREDARGRKYENYYDRSTPDGFNMNFSTLSLMLTPAQVARVELAEKAGELVAVLRHPKDSSSASLGQVTVASLLDPLPAETVDVVLDAEGNLLGRIVGDNVVDANGRIIGRIVDGQAIGLDGKVMGRIVRGLAADDPLLRMRERATVVRDAEGNVVGKVVDGKVIDAAGNVIGSYADGKATGLDGRSLGSVTRDAALDASGRVIDMSRSQVQGGSETSASLVDGKLVDALGNVVGETGEIVRDASGKVLGRVVDGKLVDAQGKVLGTVRDGQVVAADGQVLGKVEQAVLGRDGTPLADAVLVVRDANGNVLGTVVGDDVIDAQGRKIGYIRDGKVYDLAGNLIPSAMIGLRQDAQQVVRDVAGKVIGSVRGDTVYDAEGKAIGKVRDGKVVDASGNVVARGISLGLEAPREVTSEPRRREARMIQFIPGGTGKQGVIPVQTLRLE
ncbi:Flp pilus assembly protein CpaB [Stutzerimonas nitrititolerans]|uniref:Flp pilus assembly protein CpaB n=1 Tax=Stutzerimonas nitrititolerans TaxID=2482751 RepID=UPI0015E275AC|nr:Flp pilus assembly protein CpaB [Stutzerimonas nitrititolerans]MBA1185933.1 Flp pilus assembly protein CpaB [Stutzerimonas stutzeri]